MCGTSLHNEIISSSSLSNSLDASNKIIAKSAFLIVSIDLETPIFSILSPVSLIPAVSNKCKTTPLRLISPSTTSLVVPAISVTIAFDSPNKALSNEGLGQLPQIVVIIDELADLMMVAAKEVEDAICRLAQKARAAGMHLVIATQRPSVDVITGIIKANIPSRIAFAVSSQVDSRTILDGAGAEKLLGKGDMLFYPSGDPKPTRIQGAFVSDGEVEKIVGFIKANGTATYSEEILESIENNNKSDKELAEESDGDDTDPLLMEAMDTVVETGQASTSFIQRRFKVGYARAGRIIDQLEERGVISGYQGSKPRQVLMTIERLNELKMASKSTEE